MGFAFVALFALLIDAAFGWPQRLYQRLSHPVVWLGRLISWLEARMNIGSARQRLKASGLIVIAVAGAAGGVALMLQGLARLTPAPILAEALLCWPLIAARSLHDHVAAVRRPLADGDLPGARAAVAMIVGRDVTRADEAAIARAATESLAENASDGVIAPLFWTLILGLPGLAVYKAVNTMDSMIGHRSERYLYFGRVAARLDDVMNWIPARLSALCFALAAPRRREALAGAWREAGQHRSPNAGWPEAAMAHGLGLRLSGPRDYPEGPSNDPYINAAGRDPDADSLGAALRLYHRTLALVALALALIGLLTW